MMDSYPNLMLKRLQVEDFLFHEARLLDGWQLEAWAELFTADGEYLMPPVDNPDAPAGTDLFLIYDDRHRLTERAKRLLKRQAHAEFPHSVLHRMVGNVSLEPAPEGLLRVRSNFVLHRSRNGETQVFPGHACYELLEVADGGFRIRCKRVMVDSDSLRTQGRVSIIL